MEVAIATLEGFPLSGRLIRVRAGIQKRNQPTDDEDEQEKPLLQPQSGFFIQCVATGQRGRDYIPAI
jgi:hypothetical protein